MACNAAAMLRDLKEKMYAGAKKEQDFTPALL